MHRSIRAGHKGWGVGGERKTLCRNTAQEDDRTVEGERQKKKKHRDGEMELGQQWTEKTTTRTYLGEVWRWVSGPYGEVVVNVGWAWRGFRDAGDELPEAVKREEEEGDSGLQSQEL